MPRPPSLSRLASPGARLAGRARSIGRGLLLLALLCNPRSARGACLRSLALAPFLVSFKTFEQQARAVAPICLNAARQNPLFLACFFYLCGQLGELLTFLTRVLYHRIEPPEPLFPFLLIALTTLLPALLFMFEAALTLPRRLREDLASPERLARWERAVLQDAGLEPMAPSPAPFSKRL